MLRAVYDAMRAEALENGAGTDDVPAYEASGQGSRRDIASDDGIAADAIRRYFRNRVWWNGLSQSTAEVDVWILHLRCASREIPVVKRLASRGTATQPKPARISV